MLIADGIGILIGVVMCKRIPERVIKLVSAAVFIVFGFIGCGEVLQSELHLAAPAIILILAVLGAATGVAAYLIIRKNRNDFRADEKIACLRDVDVKNLE